MHASRSGGRRLPHARTITAAGPRRAAHLTQVVIIGQERGDMLALAREVKTDDLTPRALTRSTD
jgi:hypothetical protein